MTYIPPEDKLIGYIDSLVTPSSIVLDIGCGTKKIANSLHCAKVVTLDAWAPFAPDILCDLTAIPKLPCEDDSFDLVLLIDVIEHLPKEHGIKILEEAKRVSRKSVVIFTPLWWDPNIKEFNNPKSPYYQNEYDKHLSLWGADDLGEFEQIKQIEELSEYFLGVWRKGMKKIDLFLDISHQCNYNCLFCRSNLLPRETLRLEQVNHINELLLWANSVDITGYGEVTIHPQF
jgi:SAM-dependent methyltransferase